MVFFSKKYMRKYTYYKLNWVYVGAGAGLYINP